MLGEFRAFLLRGNLVELAVAVVIGVAFNAVVNALVVDIVTPIIGAIGGKHDFSSLTFTINGSAFLYGDFLNELISFVTIAAAVFFVVVKPMNALNARRQSAADAGTPMRDCPECQSSIPAAARRCAQCTAEVSPAM